MGREMIAGVLVGLAAVPAAATAGDYTASGAIAANDLRRAEQVLLAARRVGPERPELMLNLAAVYRRTGRDAQAREMYRAVLEQPAATLAMADGSVASSHALAGAALARRPLSVAMR